MKKLFAIGIILIVMIALAAAPAGRISLGVSGGYGVMYVGIDGADNIPSDYGFNTEIRGMYRLNETFSVGFGLGFGQYHYDSREFPGAYTVVDPVITAEACFPAGESLSLTVGLSAGADVRMYGSQKGLFLTAAVSLEAGYRAGDSVTLGIRATGGMTFQKQETDPKITVGGLLKVNL